ncbi:TPA: hypothetical protein RVS72_000518 [Pasteurella multocida]|uniref:hypothetical protein n=2 Tax=Pasteurella multocida TaxID=747 RepID=UPI00061A5C31|nr:hypothetical protein [Pasteurella multocida]AKD40275.1 hypothetical protein I927_05260 [Pasteurella multocida OH1905]URJ91532.1 hypothetical protein M9415_02210 [Pasteurella multocida]WRK04582.1 hypothetical protein RFF10_07530 [Pasteurella multocida]HDR1155603.1 hypothetical protein [Pasteurella multocida]HDR1506137.1 hypothetical protein [Pasteurella multocida]
MEAKITFYDIERCGFYKYGSKELLFGNIKNTLNNLHQWVQGASLSETKVHDAIGPILGTYVAALEPSKDSKSYLLVLWNQVPSTEAGVLSLKTDAVIGQKQTLIENPIEQDSIAGYPTCFWFIPEKNCFASIVFEKGLTGKSALEIYLFNFLQHCSQYVRRKQDEMGKDIIYFVDPNDEENQTHRRPYFVSKVCHKATKKQFFEKHLDKVRKILFRTHFNASQKVPYEGYQKILKFLGCSLPSNYLEKQLSYQIEMTVDEQSIDFETLYKTWQDEFEELNIDYGFKLTGDSTPYWFSGSIAKGEFELSGLNLSDLVENPKKLLAELEAQRSEILKVLP